VTAVDTMPCKNDRETRTERNGPYFQLPALCVMLVKKRVIIDFVGECFDLWGARAEIAYLTLLEARNEGPCLFHG
jgi:hypothetical protein